MFLSFLGDVFLLVFKSGRRHIDLYRRLYVLTSVLGFESLLLSLTLSDATLMSTSID